MKHKRTQLDRDVMALTVAKQTVNGIFQAAITGRWNHDEILSRVLEVNPRSKRAWVKRALSDYWSGWFDAMYTHLEWRLYRKSDKALVLSSELPDGLFYSDYFDTDAGGEHTYIGRPDKVYSTKFEV